jgi:hypothetical protein
MDHVGASHDASGYVTEDLARDRRVGVEDVVVADHGAGVSDAGRVAEGADARFMEMRPERIERLHRRPTRRRQHSDDVATANELPSYPLGDSLTSADLRIEQAEEDPHVDDSVISGCSAWDEEYVTRESQ